MAKLQWLKINKFRSVKPGTRLTFSPGYNVPLGHNGTGKTTLLSLVAAVVRSDFSELRDVDFDLQYALYSETSTATISVRNHHEHVANPSAPDLPKRSAFLALEARPTEPVFSAQVNFESQALGTTSIEIQGSSGTLHVTDGAATHAPITFVVSHAKHDLWWKILDAFSAAPHLITVFRAMESLFNERSTIRFDESLDYFAQISHSEIQLLNFGGDDIHVQSRDSLPESLLNELTARSRQQWGEALYIIDHDQLPFLQEVVRLLDFESAQAILELKESAEHEVADTMLLGNLRFLFTHRGGWRISEKLLSYGQKRMLAFLYYLATVSSVAVADELVNGLHHRWIRACKEALGQRQVFLTSQNPLLLDHIPFDNPEQVRSTFILCHWAGENEQARMLWENMSQEAAEDFFESYKVGFQQVGELLQAKGLW